MRGVARLLIVLLLVSGCGRAHYRRSADREVYPIIAEHACPPAAAVGRTNLDPSPESRLYDPTNPDRPPRPPDDPCAHQFMERPNGMHGFRRWDRDGVADSIELNDWSAFLDLGPDGRLKLDSDRAVQVALTNSREYQSALEEVYLAALGLTFNRFEFTCRWFGGLGTTYSHFGNSSAPTESNQLTTSERLGFTRTFAAGGQLLVDLANQFVFEFTGRGRFTAGSNLLVSYAQPLLRGGGRAFRLEGLTQQERNVLYTVRDFARFRKTFWADTTTRAGGYLSLLLQLQNIRNQRANLESQLQNLKLHDELFRGGKVSVVQVDQVFQSYQQARLALVQTEQAFQNSLDDYKLRLGMPPRLPVDLDDRALQQFQLTDPAIEGLQAEVDTFLTGIRERDLAPTVDLLRAGYAELRAFGGRVAPFLDLVEGERGRWGRQLDRPAAATDDRERRDRARASHEQFGQALPQLRQELTHLIDVVNKEAASLTERERTADWARLQRRTRQLIALLTQMFVIETQIRVNLIELPAVDANEDEATRYALNNRLDLMNQLARVEDAWRKITVTANGLLPDLNILTTANLVGEPGSNHPLDFSAANSRYNVSIQFDGPLNRLAERNVYRASLVNYQRVRRDCMALTDRIELSIRRDLRALATDRLGFEIARITLISAARQVEAARERLLVADDASGTSGTLDMLNALNALLQARNNLAGSYIGFEQDRIQLLLDLEALQLDDRGVPLNERRDSPRTFAAGQPLPDIGEILPAPRRIDDRP